MVIGEVGRTEEREEEMKTFISYGKSLPLKNRYEVKVKDFLAANPRLRNAKIIFTREGNGNYSFSYHLPGAKISIPQSAMVDKEALARKALAHVMRTCGELYSIVYTFNGRKVTATFTPKFSTPYHEMIGESICSWKDEYSKPIGKAIAALRAVYGEKPAGKATQKYLAALTS